jgi:DNA-binding MarR family transcriptional regulator
MEVNYSVDFLEAYCRFIKEQTKTKDTKLTDFAYWILNSENQTQNSSKNKTSNSLSINEVEEEISRLLILMYRHAKIHIKTYLTEFPEIVQEDFTYLYALKRSGSLTKTQLIEVNVHEKTSGLEIIRRLLKHELIQESIDENDKRSKRIVLTEKGETIFLSLKTTTRKIAKLITGKLTSDEKANLHSILKKMDLFHQPLYLSKTKIELNFALQTYSLN